MKDVGVNIEERLLRMKTVYKKVNEVLDSIPDAIPAPVRDLLKSSILGDASLKELMEGLDNYRPPRFLLVGRTGVGKSSLINALCNSCLAYVSDTQSCTKGIEPYNYMDHDRVLMEILDTRGIAESESLNDEQSAESQLIAMVNTFSPDATIFMLNCAHRDSVDDDVEFVKRVVKAYEDVNKVTLPIVVVINRADEVAPGRAKEPDKYPDNKLRNINAILEYYKGIIEKNGLKIEGIIPVSSYIEWKTSDGVEKNAAEINEMSEEEISELEIVFDGRYRIEELRGILEQAIPDFQARMGLRMAYRLDELIKRLSDSIIGIFSAIAGVVALTPIPVSDIFILVILQSFMVVMIAILSGRDLSHDSAKEFIFSIGGIGGLGFVFRIAAQQASKLLNAIVPAAGSVISMTIASTGTAGIGKAAKLYYIDNQPIEEAKKALSVIHK